MNSYQLEFATIHMLSPDIAEVIIHQDVEMDKAMTLEINRFFENLFTKNFGLLINRINSYSHDFEAMMELGNMIGLKAVGVVSYTKPSQLTTESVVSFPRDFELNIKAFADKNQVFKWLESELQSI